MYITMHYIIHTSRIMWWRYFCVVWCIPDPWCCIKSPILSYPLSWPRNIPLLCIVLASYHNRYVSWRIDRTTHNIPDTHLCQHSTAHTTIPASVSVIVHLIITPICSSYLQPCRNTWPDWTGPDRTRLDWILLDWHKLGWAGLSWAGMGWASHHS
jgi:hypothetical protein